MTRKNAFMSVILSDVRVREMWWDPCELNLKKKKKVISNTVDCLSSPKSHVEIPSSSAKRWEECPIKDTPGPIGKGQRNSLKAYSWKPGAITRKRKCHIMK